MSISIENIRSATSAEWDQIWQTCTYSTYFQSREWAEIWNVYTKGKMVPDPKMVEFSDAKRVLLPLSSQKQFKGLMKNYISSPGGTFGGWISVDHLAEEHAALLVTYLTKKLGNLVWRINPYNDLLFVDGIEAREDDVTHALSLTGGFDSIYRIWTKGRNATARKARKAKKAGISVKCASRISDWHSYYKIYEDSIQRWGNKASSRYNLGIFHEMFKLDSPNIKLWLAVYRDEVVAGALIFYAKNHVVYWHGAALERYFNLRCVNLLMYEVIKHACDRGYSWFDFNPSGGHEGVKAFKKSFGAEALGCPVVTVETKWHVLARKLTRVAARIQL